MNQILDLSVPSCGHGFLGAKLSDCNGVIFDQSQKVNPETAAQLLDYYRQRAEREGWEIRERAVPSCGACEPSFRVLPNGRQLRPGEVAVSPHLLRHPRAARGL